MIKLNKFLFCLPIELGGYLIASWQALMGALLVIAMIITLSALYDASCKDIFKILHFIGIESFLDQLCSDTKFVLMMLSCISMVYGLFYFISYIVMVFGIALKKHKLIIPALTLEALMVVTDLILCASNLNLLNFSMFLTMTLFNSYSFTIKYSLYHKYKAIAKESNQHNVQTVV
ncbi:hypothetical protein PVAND_006275 [Polypedilum vanderplanki]|uniref:Uncharacterized protein n=1 Tax=Polypedilum vanderplanki TaxID=319348 RepID=A0A9J6C3G4_POLVA|nr:hypothetical protein PVAND_006275 [Polypedilum vanderplanki]